MGLCQSEQKQYQYVKDPKASSANKNLTLIEHLQASYMETFFVSDVAVD